MTIKEETVIFDALTRQMRETFTKKRKDYGQTTSDTYDRFGPVSLLTRMYDKLGRIENLLCNQQKTEVKDESIDDTLLDLANYALITILEIRKRQSREVCCGEEKT